MVNKYAADMMAQKYKRAVMMVITILSECDIESIFVSICSIRFGFRLNNGIAAGGLAGASGFLAVFMMGSEQRFLAIFTAPRQRRKIFRLCLGRADL